MTTSTLQDRIKLALEKSGLSKTDLWKGCGVSSGTVTTWVKGPNQTISGVNLMNAAKLLGVNPDWLATGRGNISSTTESASKLEDESTSVEILNPYHSKSIKGIKLSLAWIKEKVAGANPNQLSIIFIDDDSMSPTISQGDFIIVNSNIRKFSNDGIYIINSNAGSFIKRIQKLLDGTYLIKSDNPSYETQSIKVLHLSKINIAGKAVSIWAEKLA